MYIARSFLRSPLLLLLLVLLLFCVGKGYSCLAVYGGGNVDLRGLSRKRRLLLLDRVDSMGAGGDGYCWAGGS